MNSINQIRFHRNPDTPGIEICEVIQSRHEFPNHSHDEIFAFSLMADGGHSWNNKNNDDSIVYPGDIAVIPPGLIHSGAPLNGRTSTYKMIYINHAIITETASDIFEKTSVMPEFKKIVMHCRSLVPLYINLHEAVSRNATPLEVESALTSFFGFMLTKYGTTEVKPAERRLSSPALARAAEFLASELDRKISLEEAAAEAGLSKYHFLRSFKHQTGLSPHAYRIQKRIEAARKFILDGKPFSEIALDIGFTDQSHFTNQFRNYIGATPNQYLAD